MAALRAQGRGSGRGSATSPMPPAPPIVGSVPACPAAPSPEQRPGPNGHDCAAVPVLLRLCDLKHPDQSPDQPRKMAALAGSDSAHEPAAIPYFIAPPPRILASRRRRRVTALDRSTHDGGATVTVDSVDSGAALRVWMSNMENMDPTRTG